MDRAAHLERLRKCTDSVLRYSDLVLRHASADQRDALLAPARRLVADYAQLELQLDWAADALRTSKDQMVGSLSVGSEVDLTELTTAVQRAASRQDAAAVRSHQAVLQLQRAEEAAAPAGGQRETADAGDGELQMTETVQTSLDPWSKQAIRQPYRNRHCGHLYDFSSLEQVLGKLAANRKKRRVTCPYVGCANKTPLKWEDITEDRIALRAIESQQSS